MIKTKLGYFKPITSSDGLKELRWQQMPFLENLNDDIHNQHVSCETIIELKRYLSGRLTRFSIPIDFSSWSSEMIRWFRTIMLIPYGQVTSYQDLASRWGNIKAARSAGRACRKNPIPIIIPCHRILNTDMTISQYSGGDRRDPTSKKNLARKKWLLNLEARDN